MARQHHQHHEPRDGLPRERATALATQRRAYTEREPHRQRWSKSRICLPATVSASSVRATHTVRPRRDDAVADGWLFVRRTSHDACSARLRNYLTFHASKRPSRIALVWRRSAARSSRARAEFAAPRSMSAWPVRTRSLLEIVSKIPAGHSPLARSGRH